MLPIKEAPLEQSSSRVGQIRNLCQKILHAFCILQASRHKVGDDATVFALICVKSANERSNACTTNHINWYACFFNCTNDTNMSQAFGSAPTQHKTD